MFSCMYDVLYRMEIHQVIPQPLINFEGCLISKVVFHPKSFPSKVEFYERLFFIKVPLPLLMFKSICKMLDLYLTFFQ